MKRFLALILCLCMLMPATISFAASKASQQEFTTESLPGEIVFDSPVLSGNNWSDSNLSYPHKWTSEKGATVTFDIKGVKEGNYEAYYWLIPHKYDAGQIDFYVDHNGNTTKKALYAKLQEGETVSGGWVSLGVFDFAAKGDQKVYTTCPGENIRATKIRLVPTTKEVSDSTEETEETVQTEEVPLIGDKKPDSNSQIKDITLKPMGKCKWVGYSDENGDKNWSFSNSLKGPMTDYARSLWIAGADERAYVIYNPEIEAVGDVNIFVYLLWWAENQNPNAKYEIYHNGKVDTVMLDPTTLTQSSWVYLGTYDFSGNPDEEYVKLVVQPNDNPVLNTRASTVMFEIVNAVNGGIWQTKYVSPDDSIEAMQENGEMASLDMFSDMKEHWARYDVEYMANEGLVSGKAEGIYDPEAQITRAEYVTILDRAMGYELVTGESYTDVASDSWYATYVATAKANGLLNGLPTDDGFKPEQPITREEMGLFTYNAIKATKKNDEWVKKLADGWDAFQDTAEVSEWAKEGLKYLIQTGIIKGTSDTTVSPMANATRAQGAVILKRFMQQFVWAGPPTNDEWVLTFNDEFNSGEMDWSVWRSDASAPGHILSSRWPENVEVHDGALHLVIHKEERAGKEWTAASVWVRPEVFAQTYGYWEARYKYAETPGVNNSFWTYVLHAFNIHKNPDTKTHYEIDINEGHYPNKINLNYHCFATGESKQYSQSYKSDYDLSADYHTYAMEWTPTEIRYYHDGKLLRVQENYNAHQRQFPYLSSAVINWAGQIKDDADGSAQVVDYVRVWQRKADIDNPELNYKGEPMVGVAPAAQNLNSPDPSKNDATIQKVTVKDQAIDSETYPGEIIIPATLEGSWSTSTKILNYTGEGKEHYWSNTVGAVSKYPLKDVKKGEYKVYMWRLPHQYNIDQMNINLHQDGEVKYFGSLALRLPEGETAESGWVEIGTLNATGDKNAFFQYTCEGDNCRASAVKLVPLK